MIHRGHDEAKLNAIVATMDTVLDWRRATHTGVEHSPH
ncbi:hypothetical protein A2U01_0082976, partial [Trifolium medium]|nr:hypothetical protein [Trifolium medium]